MENTFKAKLKKLFIILLPGLIAFGINCFCYIVPKHLIPVEKYVYLDMAIDSLIPFVPVFVIIYYMSFAQWLNYFLQGCFGPEELRNRYFSADILGKIVSFFVFLLWPLAMRWPQLPSDGNIIIKLVALCYGVDTPTGAFPSFHCFYSWVALRYSFEREPKERRWISYLQLVFSLLVFASTVLIKQHYFIDIFGGIAFAEAALQITGHTGLADMFGRMIRKLSDFIEKHF
jgi:membrane-associated phospholipid phosphatase